MDDATVTSAFTLTALRPHLESGSDHLSVIETAISMLRLTPGTELAIRTGSERADDTPGYLTVHMNTTDEVLARELADLLDCVAEISTGKRHVRPTPSEPMAMLAARPDTSNLGFQTKSGGPPKWRMPSTPLVDEVRLFRALARWNAGYLEIRVGVSSDASFWMSSALVGVTTAPLSVRAALHDALPGITFAPADAWPGRAMRCEQAEICQALRTAIPLGGTVPPGFHMAAPAAIPVARLGRPSASTAIGDNRVDDIRLGVARTDAGEPVGVELTASERLRHIHVVGATGTGKSTLLASVVHQIAHSTQGALVLDPHGSLIDRITKELPAAAATRCTIVRANDLDNPVPLNPLATDGEVGLSTAISDIGQMFYELFDPNHTGIVGPRFEDRIAHALRALATLRGPQASLLDVPVVLEHKGMRRALDAVLEDPREKAWWRNETRSKQSGEYADLVSWCNSKFERFSASPALRAILGSGHDAYDPVGSMDGGEIILVDLAKGQIGQTASRLLGYLLLNRFWVAAMNRQTDRPFHVIVDEAHSVMAGSLVNMLSEGRKFGIAVTVAHQFLGQLDWDVAAALSGNAGTSVMFRANGPHVRPHVEATGGLITAATLANLPSFTAIVTRAAATTVTTLPHTMTVEPIACGCVTASVGDVEKRTRERTMGLDLSQLDPDTQYPVNGETPAARPEERPGQAKFLDEWLAKRKAMANTSGDAAASHPDDESAA